MLPGGSGVLKTYVVRGDELHEFRRGWATTLFVYSQVRSSIRFALKVQITWTRVWPLGVQASETESMWQSVAMATSATLC